MRIIIFSYFSEVKSRVAIFLFVVVSAFVLSNTSSDWEGKVYKYDKSGYHLHLPAFFIYNDIQHLNFYSYIDDVYRPSNDYKNYCIDTLENGNRINRYSIGLAVLETPFFLAAHGINKLFHIAPADGYSLPYQWATIISNAFWTILGLFVLRRFLQTFFSDNVIALTLLAIAFGTNLYHYTVFNPGMTHGYSFFLFSCMLLCTERLYRTNKQKYFYLLGCILALIAITRISNLVIIVIPVFWNIRSVKDVSERIIFIKKSIVPISISLLLFLAVVMLQLSYWKYITGNWLHDAYGSEGFVWTEPAIWKGLFSFRKGWFIYTPIACLTVAGLFFMRQTIGHLILPIVCFMAINLYIIFCWWNWWYGGSFGCRPLIESFAVLSLPLASLINIVFLKAKAIKATFVIVLLLLIFLNMFQSYQAYKNILHWELNTGKYYSKVFLKTKVPDGAEEYLLRGGELNREMEERLAKVNK